MAPQLAIAEEKPLSIAEEKPDAPVKPPRSTGSDLAIGAAKGVGSTVTNLGALARKIPGVSSLDRLVPPITFSITPENFTQTVGKTGEQLAEFFVPSSLAGKSSAYLVSMLPKAKWALAIARGVPEAAGAYAVSKAQGDPNAKLAAGVAGAIPGAAGLMGKAGPALEKAAQRGVGKAFQATDARMTALAKKIAPDVLSGQHGSVWAMTMRAVEERAERMTESIGNKIEQQVQQYGKLNFSDTVDGIVHQMEQAKDAYRAVISPQEVLAKTGELAEHQILFNASKVAAISRLQNTLKDLQTYNAGTLENLIGARRAWDEVVAAAGGFAERGRTGTRAASASLVDKTEAWAHREGVRAIRQVLSDPKFTDLKKLQALNAQYSFWVTVQDLAEGSLNKHRDQAGRVIKALGIATGALAGEEYGRRRPGGGTTGGIVGGMLGAAGMTAGGAALGRQIVEAGRSPAFRLASAQVKHRLANAIMSGHVEEASKILGRVTGKIVAGSPPEEPPQASGQ